MSRQTRTFHLRAPLVVKNQMCGTIHETVEEAGVKLKRSRPGWVQVTPVFVTDRINRNGGATVLISGDPDDKTGFVEVQVTFCRPDEPFSRRLGRQNAASKENYVIHVTDIPRELHDIEHQMLSQLHPYLRKHSHARNELTRPGGWAFGMYFFLPKPPVEQANG